MKIKDLLEGIKNLDPEEEVCLLIYRKELFDYTDEDEVELSVEAWSEVVDIFEECSFDDIYEQIGAWVSEVATEVE